MDIERTCFGCAHYASCIVRIGFAESSKNLKFNMDTNKLPGNWVGVFRAMANACFSYKETLESRRIRKHNADKL